MPGTALARLRGLAANAALAAAACGLYEPGQEFTDRIRSDLPARIRINNLGFRGKDLVDKKPGGAFRALVLGDSYTFGDHVDDGESYPARLEEALGAMRPGLDVQVVNAGANGFGILDEAAMWRRAGERVDPDVVVVTFSPNDVSDMTRPAPLIDQMLSHASMKTAPVIGPAIRLAQNTAIFNGLQMVAARIRVMTRSSAAVPEVEPARAGPEAAPRAWEAYHRALAELAADLKAGRRGALLVLYPSHGNVSGEDRPFASDLLPAWAEGSGMACLDLLAAFRAAAARGEVLYLVPRDSHPSPDGHRLAARTTAAEIDRLGWLPPSASGTQPIP
jgi:GDSL-like lipase/acylhydrolase family protein